MIETVLEETRGRVLVITMNRPEVRNAMDLAMAEALAGALDRLETDDTLAVGVLTGAGGTFSAGMDLKAFLRGERPEVPGRGLGGLTRMPPRTPLVAAVDGVALAGGFELVLACDLVVAAEDATFGLPEVQRGLMAGSGGLLRLGARIPLPVAMELALTGERLSAQDAARWGLVNRVVPPGQVVDAAVELADRIAACGPVAVQASKEVLAGTATWSIAEGWARQDELLGTVLASEDAREGAQAFAERRPPNWSGR